MMCAGIQHYNFNLRYRDYYSAARKNIYHILIPLSYPISDLSPSTNALVILGLSNVVYLACVVFRAALPLPLPGVGEGRWL